MFIAIDLDETLGNFVEPFWSWHHNKYGWSLKYEQITDYFWPQIIKRELNMDIPLESLLERVIEFLTQDIETLISLKTPIEHSYQTLKQLKDMSDKIIVLTARDATNKKVVEHTKAWINHYFPNIFNDVIFTNQFNTKLTVHDAHNQKAQICHDLGVDILIDDAPHYFENFEELNKKGILFTKPWNKNAKLNKNTKRVNTWRDVINIINTL